MDLALSAHSLARPMCGLEMTMMCHAWHREDWFDSFGIVHSAL